LLTNLLEQKHNGQNIERSKYCRQRVKIVAWFLETLTDCGIEN